MNKTHIRKKDHINLAANSPVESTVTNSFEKYQLNVESCPELNWDNIETKQFFLNRNFKWPFLITGMTGGVDTAKKINLNLAAAATKYNIPMGVGSQRIAIENPKKNDTFDLKTHYSDLFLIGNIGIAQLIAPDGINKALQAIELIAADALAVHLNVLQECIQDEGDRHFKGAFEAISSLCQQSPVPIIVKEVGCGINYTSAQKLISCNIAALDVNGLGGTSWSYIEGQRSAHSLTQRLGTVFKNWGIPTAQALENISTNTPNSFPLIATGGIRDGLMAAKAIALGAHMVGIGLPLLKAALHSAAAVEDELEFFTRGLKIALMASGSAKLADLKIERSGQ